MVSQQAIFTSRRTYSLPQSLSWLTSVSVICLPARPASSIASVTIGSAATGGARGWVTILSSISMMQIKTRSDVGCRDERESGKRLSESQKPRPPQHAAGEASPVCKERARPTDLPARQTKIPGTPCHWFGVGSGAYPGVSATAPPPNPVLSPQLACPVSRHCAFRRCVFAPVVFSIFMSGNIVAQVSQFTPL